MATLDNPAGRLHALLLEYGRASSGYSVEVAWRNVLGIEETGDIVAAMAELASLPAAVHQAVRRQDRSSLRESCAMHIAEWASPILSGLAAHVPAVGPPALTALSVISEVLSETASEGSLPDDEQHKSLRDEVLAAIEETRDSTEAPPEVQQLILERLHQIVWALDHVHISGPGAVAAAVERLAGSLGMRGPEVFETGAAKRAWKVARKVYCAYAKGPEVQQALAAWSGFVGDVLSLGP